jgi:hypothetical protein
MGKHSFKIKKSPFEATYQKFHPKILVLGILLLPPTHQIGSRVSTKIHVHSWPMQKLAFVAS